MTKRDRATMQTVLAKAFDRAAMRAGTTTHAASIIISELQMAGFDIVAATPRHGMDQRPAN